MSGYPDHKRNLNPTPAARVAMIIWGKQYSEKRGGSMDFWDSLSVDQQNRCEHVVTDLRHNVFESGEDDA